MSKVAIIWAGVLFLALPAILMWGAIPIGDWMAEKIGHKATAIIMVYALLAYAAIMLGPIVALPL